MAAPGPSMRSETLTEVKPMHMRKILTSALIVLAGSLTVASTADASATYDMRGEWAYSLTCSCGQNAGGTMLLKQMELTSGAFSGTTVLDGLLEGTASGTVTGNSATSLKIVLPNTPFGEYTFTVSAATIEPASNKVAGSGAYNNGSTGEIKAERIHDLAEVEQREKEATELRQKEREIIEAEEKQKAKEAVEAEEKQKTAKEAEEKQLKEKAAAEQREREAREARERQQSKEAKEAQEARERQQSKEAQEAKEHAAQAPTSAKPTTKTLAVSAAGLVSLELSNTNAYEISGEVALIAGASKSATGQHKNTMLADGSFSIASYASKLVKLRLSKNLAAKLAHRKSLPVVVKITTRASGHTSITATYSVTLRAASHARR
jgi:flagellar biosynthesis GTPase FlhF